MKEQNIIRIATITFIFIILGIGFFMDGKVIRFGEDEPKKIIEPVEVVQEETTYYYFDLEEPEAIYTKDEEGNFIRYEGEVRYNGP